MSRRGRSSAKRKRWEENPVTLTIDSLSHEGRGIGKFEGKVVLVDGALPGEEVEVIYTRRRTRFDEAKLKQVLKASEERVSPPCAHAEICGGCSFQHFDAGRAIEFKQGVLAEQLTHFAGQLPEQGFIEPVRDRTIGYRRRARLAVKYVEKKGVLVGFREKLSHFVANIDQCLVLDSRVGELIEPLKKLIFEMEIRDRIPQIEVAMGEPEEDYGQVALIFRHLVPISESDSARLEAFANQHQLLIYLQEKGPDTVKKVYPRTGKDRLEYRLPEQGVTFEFYPTDFTQVNAGINQKMVTLALELLALKPEDRVLDLFCGLGNFSLAMAKSCAHVTGVEGSDLMVGRAYDNAKLNGIENVRFCSEDLFSDAEKWKDEWVANQYDKILLDPPRSGAQEVVKIIDRFKANRLVYVSCNPATLARDAGILMEKGYRMITSGVMDMFPHTTHVESIALFEK